MTTYTTPTNPGPARPPARFLARTNSLPTSFHRQLEHPIVVHVGDVKGASAMDRHPVRTAEVGERQHLWRGGARGQPQHPAVVVVGEVEGAGAIDRHPCRLVE